METIFSILIFGAIFTGAIWGISVKLKELSRFVKEKGWNEVKTNIKNFINKVLKTGAVLLVGTLYLVGLIIIPQYFDTIFQNENYTSLYFFAYLVIGFIIYYYINGIKRRKTKNIVAIIVQDLESIKNGFKKFIREMGDLVKALFKLIGVLLVIGAITLAFVLFGWFIVSLSATTIIIILLILILLK